MIKDIRKQFLGLWSSKGRFIVRGNITKLMLAVIVTLVAFQAGAEDKIPSGTVEIEEKELSLIIGGSYGHGTLHFEGADYPLKISGIKVGGVGVSKISAVGEVYDLYDVSKFPGTYVAGEYGITLGGGMGGLVLKNQNGVYMHLKSTSEGIALSLGASGLTVELK
jgi:hypothetical protein